MSSEKRMIHSYEVVSSIKIGDKEIVVAMDEKNADGEKYMCCFVDGDGLFEHYSEAAVSDDYAEIVKLYGTRIADASERHIEAVKQLGIPVTVITKEDCIPDHYSHSLKGKVVAIDVKYLRPEFQRADKQLYFVTGGFGAAPNARGRAVFCTNLHSGEETRIERMEIMGEVKPERMPEWAKEKAETLMKSYKNKDKGAER